MAGLSTANATLDRPGALRILFYSRGRGRKLDLFPTSSRPFDSLECSIRGASGKPGAARSSRLLQLSSNSPPCFCVCVCVRPWCLKSNGLILSSPSNAPAVLGGCRPRAFRFWHLPPLLVFSSFLPHHHLQQFLLLLLLLLRSSTGLAPASSKKIRIYLFLSLSQVSTAT